MFPLPYKEREIRISNHVKIRSNNCLREIAASRFNFVASFYIFGRPYPNILFIRIFFIIHKGNFSIHLHFWFYLLRFYFYFLSKELITKLCRPTEDISNNSKPSLKSRHSHNKIVTFNSIDICSYEGFWQAFSSFIPKMLFDLCR